MSYVASVAMGKPLTQLDLRYLRIQLLADACAAMLVLLFIIGISVYKPWGKIVLVNVKQQNHPVNATELKFQNFEPLLKYVLIILLLLIILGFIYMHLIDGGLKNH